MRAPTADAQNSMNRITQDLAALRGEVEALKYQAGQGGGETQRVLSRLDQMDARLAAIEQSASRTLSAGTVDPMTGEPLLPPPGMGGVTPPAPPADGGIVVTDSPLELREAVGMVRSGDPQGAIQRLREFLRKSPRSDSADDAQFFIGEAYYSLRDFNRAILEFNEVLLRYPRGDRVPAALLRQAFAFAELGDKVDARLVLQKLVSEHPKTAEAERGRQKLAELAS